VLSLHLTKAEDSATGQTNVDPKGYVTQLDSIANINAGIDIGDWKKTRALLKNAVETDPKNAAVWIAAARVEELDGKLQAARNFINQALTYCQDSEDLWLEAARLETADKSRAVLAKAVSQLPHSAKIWLAAADKESDKTMKKKIL
jgi:pre-mRNA-processing factor 6